MPASLHNSQAIVNEVGETLTSVAPWKRLVLSLDELFVVLLLSAPSCYHVSTYFLTFDDFDELNHY